MVEKDTNEVSCGTETGRGESLPTSASSLALGLREEVAIEKDLATKSLP